MAVVMLSAAALFSACQKDETNSTVTLTAIADDAATGSKAYVYNNYLCWHNTDDVKVNNVEHTITASTSGGETSATASITDVGYNENGYVAAYPASSVKTMGAGVDGDVTISVPVTQTYTTLTTANNVTAQVVPMPMVGRCSASSGTLKFHNAASLVKVTINNPAGKSLKLHQIILSARDASDATKGVIISGYQKMTSTDESISPDIDADTMVTLDCSTLPTLPLISEVSDYYLVVAPFTGKLMVRVLAVDESSKKYIFTKISTATQSISRNQIGGISINLTDNGVTQDFWGSGSLTDPYLITSYADLTTFYGKLGTTADDDWNKSTVHYLQTCDIDATASTWNNENSFFANYDGGGHFIRFKLSNTGLFKTLGDGAVIENLTLKGNDVTNNVSQWGAFSCSIANSAKVTLRNCTNEISFTNSSSTNLGGLIGYANNGSIELTLENCSNKADISGKNYVGGVLGYAYVKKIKMTRCSNEDSVTCAAGSSAYVGGLVSYANLDGNKTIDLDSCVNSGAVTMVGTTAATSGACGGIIGWLNGKNSNNTATITNCANKADVSAGGKIQGIGGIVGRFQSSSTNVKCNVYNCYSTGNLSSLGAVTDMGGIMAIYYGSTKYKIEIKNCYFSGSFLETSMTNYSGIASKKDDNSTITCTNCYSTYTGNDGYAAGISITPITNENAGTLHETLNNNRGSWSEWKASATYPVFKWE